MKYLLLKLTVDPLLRGSSAARWPPKIVSFSVFYLLSVAFLRQKRDTITYPPAKKLLNDR